MLLCCDLIAHVLTKKKQLKIKRSLSAGYRGSKSLRNSRVLGGKDSFSMLAHDQGKQSYVYYEKGDYQLSKDKKSNQAYDCRASMQRDEPERVNTSQLSRSRSRKNMSREEYERLGGSMSRQQRKNINYQPGLYTESERYARTSNSKKVSQREDPSLDKFYTEGVLRKRFGPEDETVYKVGAS